MSADMVTELVSRLCGLQDLTFHAFRKDQKLSWNTLSFPSLHSLRSLTVGNYLHRDSDSQLPVLPFELDFLDCQCSVTTDFFSIIRGSCHNLRDLAVTGGREEEEDLIALFRGSASTLTSFDHFPRISHSLVPEFASCSNLTGLCIGCTGLQLSTIIHNIPSQLEDLYFYCFTPPSEFVPHLVALNALNKFAELTRLVIGEKYSQGAFLKVKGADELVKKLEGHNVDVCFDNDSMDENDHIGSGDDEDD